MKKAMTLFLLSFFIFGIMMNSFVVLADENNSGSDAISTTSGNNDVATADDEDEVEDDENEIEPKITCMAQFRCSDGTTATGCNAKQACDRKLTDPQKEKLKKFAKEKLKKEFRENGNMVKVEREIETEDGKIKIKIKKTITDANGNKREVKIEIEEKDGKRKVKVEGKEEFETDLDISSNESEIEAETSDGERHKIKVLPDKVAQIIRERLQAANVSNITLSEIKDRNIPRVVYNIKTNKNGRFLGVFKLAMKIDSRIDPETGEIIDVNTPWWTFLVNEQDEIIPPAINDTITTIPQTGTATINSTETANETTTDEIIPIGNIMIEQEGSIAASYGPECSNKDYWRDNADWIVDVVVDDVERVNNSLNNLTRISTSRIEKYIKGTPVADKLILKIISGYSTSSDFDILLEEGNSVRVYLLDAYKVTGLEEHRGVFGFVCQGVEEI